MEKKSSLSFNHNGSIPERQQQKPSFQNPPISINPPLVDGMLVPPNIQSRSSINNIISGVGEVGYGSRMSLGSVPSVLEPEIHRLPKTNGNPLDANLLPSSRRGREMEMDQRGIRLHRRIGNGGEAFHSEGLSNSRVIAVPVGMSDHGPVEVYKEVHAYPASSITTVVERCSYIGQTQVGLQPPPGAKKRKKHSQKLKHKKEGERYLSQSSLASGSSFCSSIASDSTIVSKNSSEFTPISRSHASSSKVSLNDSRSDCGGPISKPILSSAIMQMRQALESVSNVSDNRSDKSNERLEVASNFSDTSSNLSTLSDLSGYEDEYIRIKRLVSDAVIPPEDYKKLLTKTNAKSHVSKPVPSVDYEKIIRDLHAQKEDLEIQLHRLSIQVQNAVREKELYQQQLELMNTKITETNQKQYFEVLKQRANLEGQLEMLKQELENSVYEKSRLQSKVSESAKEAEQAKSVAETAKESESRMNARLLKYEEANKDLEEKLNASREEHRKLSCEYAKVKDDHAFASDRNINLEVSLEQLQGKESEMMAEIKGLKSRVSNLQEENQSQIQVQHQVEAAASKASSELKAAQNSSSWYQEQLQLSQAARASIQQELVEARANVAKITSDKESLDMKVHSLVREAEDGQARAVREKASLVAHLEALQADMAEREALVSQMERDHGNDTKLMEDRRQRLEQDRHRIHKLRLDLSDTERHLDTLRDDLKHKCILISKYEKELKDLRTLEAVNQEVLGERDARILTLEQALSESKLLMSNAQQDLKEKLLVISTLKDEKSKLEVSFAAANNEKKEVDDAIIKVREDMTKLSSNFYRMKHDIAVKDRQVEVYKKEAEEIKQLKDSMEKKYKTLELKVKADVEKKTHEEDILSLKKDVKDLSLDKENLNGQLSEVKKNMKTFEIEKKSLGEAVRLREEQIQNMQASLENYREAILKKDEELYVAHEQNCSMEKSYTELRRDWEVLKEDNMALRQDAEAYTELERTQRREVSDLKESIQKERKLKQNLEKKMEKALKVQEEDQLKMKTEKTELEERSKDLSQEIDVLKDEKMKTSVFLEKLMRDHADLSKEIEILKQEKVQTDSKLNSAMSELDSTVSELDSTVSEFDSYKEDSINSIEMVKVLQSKLEVLLMENGSITNRHSTMQTELQVKIADLQSLLHVKTKDMVIAKKAVSERDALISKVCQEKGQASDQLANILAENTQLKNRLVTSEVQTKENKDVAENKEPTGKKHGKNSDNVQRELAALQTKYNEAEAKLKEIVKQKENLQTTVKSTKKESLLMKAKMKEFESMKAKLKELEASKVSSQDLQVFESKCNEIESKLKLEEEKVTSLEASLTAKGQLIQELELKEKDLTLEIENCHEEKRDLQLKVTTLEEICQKSQEDIDQYQMQLKVAENDRDEWMVKYESLRDIIPERDTSTQRAVQLGISNSEVPSNSQESLNVTPLDSNNTLNVTSSDIGYLSNMSQMAIANGSQFDKTMGDLQAHVNLTSKALQIKEEQIGDLQHQISVLRLSESSSSNSNTNSQDVVPHGGETIPMQVHKQQIQSLLERIKQLQIGSDSSATVKREAPATTETAAEVQMLLSKVNDLDKAVSSKKSELDKAQTKVSEFQEKHRRYESNVRLLTRKLKEHMKGRKSAEKEIQIQAEDHQNLMDEEHQRYSVLRSRYIDLEGRCELFAGQVGSLETEVEEVRSALNCARQEAQDHHQNTLLLQKEIGRLQELSKTSESLRIEVSTSEEKVKEKERRINELEKGARLLGSQLTETQTTVNDLKRKLEQQELERSHLLQQCNDAKAELYAKEQELNYRGEENARISKTLKAMESRETEWKEKLSGADEIYKHTSTELQKLKEQHMKITSESQLSRVQLQESEAKSSALESHIKVVEGELTVAKEEIIHAKERHTDLDAAHQVRLSQLEESINRSRQEVVALSTQLGQVQKERVSYQTQATELRTALHSALAQLKNFEVVEKEREEFQTEVSILPSPSPLDLTALTDLMERSVRPVRAEAPLSSLQSCLSSLKAEVATLQTQLQTKGNEQIDGSNFVEPFSDTALTSESTGMLSKDSSGAEIV